MQFLNSTHRTISCSRICAIVTAGLVTGVLQVVLSTSYATLIYGGKLNPYVSQGIGYALFGALIIASIITLFTSLPGTVGSNQDVTVAIFSIISASIIASMPPNAPLENIFFTVVIAIALTVFLTGLFLFGLGVFRIGGLVRYFPYPVVGGFLAGTGWLLLIGGFSILCGETPIRDLLQPALLARWLPTLLFSFIMVLVVQQSKNNYLLPGLLLVGFLLFYGIALLSNISIHELSNNGWLLGPFPDRTLIQPLSISKIALVDWGVISAQGANITTVLIVSSIALLLNASAFELETKQDVNLNKELRLAGIANLISSASPGFVGFRQFALSVLNHRMEAHSRLVGIIGVCVVALTLFFGAPIISYFPKPVLSGLLMYLGLTFLVEWGLKTWFTLPRIDFAIIWLVLIAIATVGFMPGVVVGLVAALIMFAISYSRTEVVRHELTGKNYQSLLPRRTDQRQILEKEGDQLYILQLQGFIFFGTAHRLLNKVKKRIIDSANNKIRYVILDFQRVDILDSTGIMSFRRLNDFMSGFDTHLIISTPSSQIKKQLIRGGLGPSHPSTSYFNSLNEGIEWCEEEILRKAGKDYSVSLSLAQQLSPALPKTNKIAHLLKNLERLEISPGTTIIDKSDKAEAFFFIESGRVITKLDDPHEPFVHLETMKNGRIVGDIGFYLGKKSTADVIADTHCVVYRLSKEKLQQLERENFEIALLLHQSVAQMLAERVTHLVRTVNALQK